MWPGGRVGSVKDETRVGDAAGGTMWPGGACRERETDETRVGDVAGGSV